MNIFFGALDWGHGHATRLIPIISEQKEKGNHIIIGASPKQIKIFEEHFPDVKIIKLSSACPVLNLKNQQLIPALLYLAKFIFSIISDKRILKKLVRKYNIEKVYSDCRFGLRNKRIHNSIITHQLNIQLPKSISFFYALINNFNHWLINKFDECIVPDYDTPNNLSGTLSSSSLKITATVKYIGPKSRLSVVKEIISDLKPELLILISGPENQRTEFENQVLKSLKTVKQKIDYLIIRGITDSTKNLIPNSINYCSAGKLKYYLKNAKYIICRSGYSTIMDLVYLDKTAMLIPTPGQGEQEYLANYLHQKELFLKTTQNNIDIPKILTELDTFSPTKINFLKA